MAANTTTTQGATTMTTTTATADDTMTLTELVQAAMDAADYADNVARIARGDGYVPRSADELAEARTELVDAEAKLAAARAAVAGAVEALTAEYAAMGDDELGELEGMAAECYGEMRAEAGNEVALYGDSWAGSGATLEAMRLDLAAMAAARPAPAPVAPAPVVEDDDTEPF